MGGVMMGFQGLLSLILFVLLFVWLLNRKKPPKDNYCFDCQLPIVRVKRHIGIGSIFVSLFTLGIWYVLVIPFYKKRCFICGSDNIGKGRVAMMEKRKLEQARQQEEALDELVRQRRRIAGQRT